MPYDKLKAVVGKVKSTPKSSKKDPKTFVLRDVNVSSIITCDKLKDLIRSQLKDDVVRDFGVGYYQGSTVVSIRSAQDLKEIWQEVKKGVKVILWCDGLRDCTKVAYFRFRF